VSLGQPPILSFLGVSDPIDALQRRVGAEPHPQDAVIALSEAGLELIEGDGDAVRFERVLPRLPVERFRVDERAVEIPENRAVHFWP
jgi:hypothetical protein